MKIFGFQHLILLWILGKSLEAQKIDNEYSTISNFLECVAVDNLTKMRLDKVVVIQIESTQREQNQGKLELGTSKETNKP